VPKGEILPYHEAAIGLLSQVGCQCSTINSGNLFVQKNRRNLYINIAGKKLPYYGRDGRPAFPWETHIKPNRLDKIEKEAKKYNAEPWLAFCYAIFDEKYLRNFTHTVKINNISFGIRLIGTSDFKQAMKPRSPSWVAVDLPRKQVLNLTYDIDII